MAVQNIFQRRFLQDKRFAVTPQEQTDTTISLSKILNLSWHVMRIRFDRLLPIGLLWSGYWIGFILFDFILTNFIGIPIINIAIYVCAFFYGLRFPIMWTGTVLGLIRNETDIFPLQRTDWGMARRLFVFLCTVAVGSLVTGLLFAVPGIVLILYYSMGTIIIIDKRVSPLAAFNQINILTRGTRLRYMVWMATLLVINLIGLMWFVIGLFVTIPLTTIAAIMIYDKLQRRLAKPIQSNKP